MRLIFCADPLSILRPDSAYAYEVAMVEQLGIPYVLISFEALVDERNAVRAIRRVEAVTTPELGIYRGWMLRPEAYQRLSIALQEKGITLINTPEEYVHCHYLPASYGLIEDQTPRSVWLTLDGQPSLDFIMQLLQPFGDKPVLLKDFVKSRKHEWFDACYIPSASDREAVERVVKRFLELQGDDLNEGLVFREFVTLEPLTTHTKSGMPLSKEYRLFFLHGQLIATSRYWEEGEYGNQQLPFEHFTAIAQRIHSRFFTMDVARQTNGDWLIIELGDAQVAGLPESIDVAAFYRSVLDA